MREHPHPEIETASREILEQEGFLTDEERRATIEREQAFERSRPGQVDPKLGTIKSEIPGVLLSLDRLDPVAQTQGLIRKPDFHVTLLGFTEGNHLLRRLKELSDVERIERIQKINQLINETDWTPVGSGSEIIRIQKTYQSKGKNGGTNEETRTSLIQRVKLRGTETFFQKLNALLGTDFSAPPTHITLYTNSTDARNATLGIGVKSEAELQTMHPKVVNIPGENTT